MCGIVGMFARTSSGLFHVHSDIFRDLLIVDQVRGMDGTGCFGVHRNRQVTSVKAGTNGSNFVELKEFDKFKDKISNSFTAAFGHNRKATVGQISSKNSHPFVEDNIVLIHNGFIANHRELSRTADVDSQAVAQALNHEEAKKLVEELSGAFALVWYDKRDKSVKIVRNSERPLWVAETANAWFFASEAWMLTAAIMRNGTNKIEDLQPIAAGNLLTLKDGEVDITKVSLRSAPSYQQSANSDPWRRPEPVYHKTSRHAQSELKLSSPPSNNGTGTQEQWNQILNGYTIGDVVDFRLKRVWKPGHAAVVGELEVEGFITTRAGDIDVSGKVSWTDEISEFHSGTSADSMGDTWVSGVVKRKGSTINGGMWMHVDEIIGSGMVKDSNGTPLPQHNWQRHAPTLSCDKCSRTIKSSELPFAKVKPSRVTPSGVLSVTCADCVEKAKTEESAHVQH